MKKIALVFAMMMGALTVNAQVSVEASVSADVVSRYIWRGQDLDKAAIQPTASISYKGLSLSAWGSYGIQGDNALGELDLTLAYSTGGFNVGITDYWNDGACSKYFLYGAHEGGHTFEANIGYDFGPAAIQWYTNFAGVDGTNKDGKRAYSSYVELSAPFKFGGLDWQAALGAVPYATTSYNDANGFAITNASLKASKEIKITPSFSVPVFAQIAANPSTQKAYFVIGFTIQ